MTAQGRSSALGLQLLGISALLLWLGLCMGSTGWLSLNDSLQDPLLGQILWDIRAPRSLGAWTAGALLGLSGAIAQGLFRNPLADPYLLGSASGAALGVALALSGGATTTLMGWHLGPWLMRLGLTGAAFVGAVAAVLLTLSLARGVQHTFRLLLAGVIVGMVLGAITALITLLAPETLQGMQAFMLGTSAQVGWVSWSIMAGAWVVCMGVGWFLAKVLDGLSLGEATAHSLGLPLQPLRLALLAALTLATGAAVAQTGLVAFVGLVAPHMVRARVQCTHAWLLWLSSAMGACLFLAADLLARGLAAPLELPVGVLTALLGGVYLLWSLQRKSG